jgi:hypothetical protein
MKNCTKADHPYFAQSSSYNQCTMNEQKTVTFKYIIVAHKQNSKGLFDTICEFNKNSVVSSANFWSFGY